MIVELTSELVQNLSVTELVARMDQVRKIAHEERYGLQSVQETHFQVPLVATLMSTKTAQSLNEESQRRLADAAFRFLLQMDLLDVSSGIANREVYGARYHEGLWSSPAHWMRDAVLRQYQIVASRIALECFFDLIYIAHHGRRMVGKSKFKTFKKWVLEEGNPYIYFVGHILHSFEFDREHRQKEVHGTSRFARALLTLHKPTSMELSIPHDLTNVLLSIWPPLIEIMNGGQPTSISIFRTSDRFAIRYFETRSDPKTLSAFVRELLANRLPGDGS